MSETTHDTERNGDTGLTRPPLTNPETAEKIRDAREKLSAHEAEFQVPEISAGVQRESRRELAREPPMDVAGEGATGAGTGTESRPDLREREWVEFRDHEFEFYELGAAQIDAIEFIDIDEDDIQQGSKAGRYVYKTLGDHGVDTDEEYWRQYSLQGSAGTDGVIDLFNRVIQAFNEDIDPETLEAAENLSSRNEG